MRHVFCRSLQFLSFGAFLKVDNEVLRPFLANEYSQALVASLKHLCPTYSSYRD